METGRRAFLERLAAAPLVPVALTPPTGAASAAEAPDTGLVAVAQALAEAVQREFGAELDGDELQALRKKLLRNLERAERLRKAARLGNADEPVTRFEAIPPPVKGGRR